MFALVDSKPNDHIADDSLGLILIDPSMRVSCSVLNGHIFSYLALALQGNAATTLHNVEPQLGCRNGIEVWRRLNTNVYAGSAIRRHTLRDKVMNPHAANGIHDVQVAIGNWESNLREYHSVGGGYSPTTIKR